MGQYDWLSARFYNLSLWAADTAQTFHAWGVDAETHGALGAITAIFCYDIAVSLNLAAQHFLRAYEDTLDLQETLDYILDDWFFWNWLSSKAATLYNLAIEEFVWLGALIDRYDPGGSAALLDGANYDGLTLTDWVHHFVLFLENPGNIITWWLSRYKWWTYNLVVHPGYWLQWVIDEFGPSVHDWFDDAGGSVVGAFLDLLEDAVDAGLSAFKDRAEGILLHILEESD